MENLENQNFEAAWRKAFDGAEVTPSDAVWDAINMRSLHSENLAMRKRIVFYQRLAAASVAILFLFGGYFLFFSSNNSANQNSTQAKIEQSTSNPLTTNNNTNQAESIDETKSSMDQPVASNQSIEKSGNTNPTTETGSEAKITIVKSSKVNTGATNDLTANTNGILDQQLQTKTTIAKTSNENSEATKKLTNKTNGTSDQPFQVVAGSMIDEMNEGGILDGVVVPFRKSLGQQGPIASIEALPITSMLHHKVKPNDLAIAYRIADATPVVVNRTKKKSIQSENMWAAVGFAAGNFSSSATGGELLQANRASEVLQLGGQPTDYDATDVPSSESSQPGYSMAYSLTAGKRVFKKWVLQGGITYLNQATNSVSSIPSVAPANQDLGSGSLKNSNSLETTSVVTYTTQNEIKSTTQFISIPIQAGYMLVDRKIGVQINGGISPDFFLKNSVYENGTQNESVSSNGGSNENYNALSLAGIGGLEVSYQIAKHYRISLVPGFRYSLTPVYKETSLASSKPFVADIGLRFRYLFGK